MILPAIDLIDKQCVRLTKGNFETKKVYPKTPLQIAREYESQGYQWLHLVDLQGSKASKPQHLDVLHNIKEKTNLLVQYGGGLQSIDSIKQALMAGADRVLLSRFCMREVDATIGAIKQFGKKKIAFCWDGKMIDGTFVLFDGAWKDACPTRLLELIKRYGDELPETIFFTDIDRDGMLCGANIDLYRWLFSQLKNVKIGASGGVATAAELPKLFQFCQDIIIGKALLEGTIEIPQEYRC